MSSNASANGASKARRSKANIPASYMRKDHPKFKSAAGKNGDYSEDPALRVTDEVASPGLFVGLATPYGAIEGLVPTVNEQAGATSPLISIKE